MNWFNKYWDLIDDYYWDLKKLGIQAIPKKVIKTVDDGVMIPTEYLNKNGGALYRRVGRSTENLYRLHSDEVALNHALNIALAIAPSKILDELLFSHCDVSADGDIHSVGKDISTYFGWDRNDTITQHDGFYVSETAALGLEIKLGATSDLDQVSKYAFLLRKEELKASKKKELALLYIVPESRRNALQKKLCMSPNELAHQIASNAMTTAEPRLIDKEIASYASEYEDVIQRMNIHIISWSEFHNKAQHLYNNIAPEGPGNITLRNLLGGFCKTMKEHSGTEIEVPHSNT